MVSMELLANHLAALCDESLAAARSAPTLRQRIAFLEAAFWFAQAGYRAAIGNSRRQAGIGPSRRPEEMREQHR